MKRQKTMKYNLLFLLDDADTKNKEMNKNTRKLQGTQKKHENNRMI